MKGKSHRNKYHRLPVVLERDGSILLTMTLEEFPPPQILEAVNSVRFKEVYDRAVADGLPEDEARALGKDAEITLRTLHNLKKKMLTRLLRPANEATGRAILEKQLANLEESRLKLRHAEARCWREFNLGAASPVIDVTPGSGRAAESEADPRWIERIESLIWKQLLITEKQTQIRGALSLGSPGATVELAGKGDEEAGKSLKLWEVQTLYREDAYAMGLGAGEAKTRLQTVQAFIEGKMPRGGGGEGGAGEGRVTFRVVGLEVEEGGE